MKRSFAFDLAFYLLLNLLLLSPVYAGWQADLLMTLEGLQQPSALAVSDAGDIFVLDSLAGKVVVFDQQGKKQNQIQTNPPFRQAMDLTIAENKLIVADTLHHQLRLFSLQGKYLQSIQLNKNMQKRGGMGKVKKHLDNKAEPVAISYQSGTLYWSDRRNHRVCKTLLSNQSTNCWGEYGRDQGQFRYPFMQASDSEDYLYVVDVLNARVQVFNYRGKSFGSISGFGLTKGSLFRPNGIALDENNHVFVSDAYFGSISSFKLRHFTGLLKDAQQQPIIFDRPIAIKIKNQRLYVVEAGKGRVQVFRLTQKVKDKSSIADNSIAKHKAIPKISRQDCLICHIEWTDNKELITTNHSKKNVSKAAQQKMCLSCHYGAVIDSRVAMLQGEQHPDYHSLKENTFAIEPKHASVNNALPVLQNDTPYCGSCHTPHAQHENETGIHPGHSNSWMRQNNQQGKLCKNCHADYYLQTIKAQKRTNHPVNIHLQKPVGKKIKDTKVYAKSHKLQQGLPAILKKHGAKVADENATTCETCHLLHGAKDKALLILKQDHLCAECHQQQITKNKKLAHQKGIHPVNIKPKNKMTLNHKTVKKVQCKSCHDVHAGSTNALLHPAKTANSRCEDCHARQASSSKQQAHHKGIHPIHEKLDKPVMLGKKKIDAVECQSCHSVHQGKPMSAALIEKQELLCASCHQDKHSKNTKEARKKGIHPVNFKTKHKLMQNHKVVEAVQCKSCHSVHWGMVNSASLLKYEKQLCFDCHPKQHSFNIREARHKGIHPVNFKPRRAIKIDNKRVSQVVCKSCHQVHNGQPYTPALSKKEAQLCDDCHSQQSAKSKKQAHQKGIHPVNIKLDRPIKFNNQTIKTLQCNTCHSLHNGKPNTPALVTKKANQMCISCHPRQHAKNLQDAKRRGIHPVGIKLKKAIKIANKKVEILDCMTCHSVHHGKPNTAALIQDNKTGELCKNCHQSESAVIYSDHNMQRTAKQSHNLLRQTPTQAGVCGSCHAVHKAPKGADYLFVGAGIGAMAKRVLKRDRSCFSCHRDKGIAKNKVLKHYTHPNRDLVLKSNSQKFPLVDQYGKMIEENNYGKSKNKGQIACITCHNPHRWMPQGGKHSTIIKGQNEEGNVLNSFLRHKSPQESFCVDCHGIETQIRYKYYHDKRGRPKHARYIK